ncbi:hypothetical protein [Bacillus sp. 166amftsu]|uniref:hypothetical protein n=1 Tax=Bacillus sp. 166amftsu TaxID=1761753 RepID=UPI000899CE7B|nr:hypothetical protein [Bacillus sp. 166amftsu]SDZ24380.1 spore-specific protein [Bacillus sp. 166amftsu]
MCSNFLISTPVEPKVAQSLEQEFSISATLYGAQAWSADSSTFFQEIWKSTLFASTSQPDEAVYPLGILKIINLSYDTITVVTSEGLSSKLEITVPPNSEAILSSSSLANVQASTTGRASRVNFLFHIFFSREPARAPLIPLQKS